MSVALVVWFVTCISAYLTLVEFLTLLSFHVELWGRRWQVTGLVMLYKTMGPRGRDGGTILLIDTAGDWEFTPTSQQQALQQCRYICG